MQTGAAWSHQQKLGSCLSPCVRVQQTMCAELGPDCELSAVTRAHAGASAMRAACHSACARSSARFRLEALWTLDLRHKHARRDSRLWLGRAYRMPGPPAWAGVSPQPAAVPDAAHLDASDDVERSCTIPWLDWPFAGLDVSRYRERTTRACTLFTSSRGLGPVLLLSDMTNAVRIRDRTELPTVRP
jgi:hypothetical protein